MNTTTKNNSIYVDPLGDAGKIIYPTIGTIMFLAIVFNITGGGTDAEEQGTSET